MATSELEEYGASNLAIADGRLHLLTGFKFATLALAPSETSPP